MRLRFLSKPHPEEDLGQRKPYHGYDSAEGVKHLADAVYHDDVVRGQEDRMRHGSLSLAAPVEKTETKEATDVSDTASVKLNQLLDPSDPRMDPSSPSFDATKWVDQVRLLFELDPDYYKTKLMGITYRNLSALGIASGSEYQATVFNYVFKMAGKFWDRLNPKKQQKHIILKPMDGVLDPGTVTVVLGRPGAGCLTLLRTIANQTYGFDVDPNSTVSYSGLTPNDIEKHFRGEVVYAAETEVHFPKLSVGQTLEFAARMRTPRNRPPGVSREDYARYMAAVAMAVYGLSHTKDTNVGNEEVHGVLGGERKRVLIAEATLNGANIMCWDNLTRGLDSATALEFIRAIKTSAKVLGTTSVIAIYQCSQAAYDLFDQVSLLYDGRQIYFGDARAAKEFFERQGWQCKPREITADFLTSLTNPSERTAKPGMEGKVPQTAEQFEEYWRNLPEYAALQERIDALLASVDPNQQQEEFYAVHGARQSKHLRLKSPYTVLIWMQIRYLTMRNFRRTIRDPAVLLFTVMSYIFMALVLLSIFYNMQQTTDLFQQRCSAMFFAILFNAFSSLLEIMQLFVARPVVNKQKNFAMYRPGAEAVALVISELPTKFMTLLLFNLIFYFMVNFRRHPGNFFFYWLAGFLCTLIFSHLFRTIGLAFNQLTQAMMPLAVVIAALVIFTGFVIPWPTMLGWSKWIYWIDPLHYVFEANMCNEFHDREFACSQFVPSGGPYNQLPLSNRACSAVGAKEGSDIVNGLDYIKLSYNYVNGHKWRNIGISIGFVIFFLLTYIYSAEVNLGSKVRGEVAVYSRLALRRNKKKQPVQKDEEAQATTDAAVFDNDRAEVGDNFPPGLIFHWEDLAFEVKVSGDQRMILDHVDGWVKPGQLTALMGALGAGKTTLLNCLSDRADFGTVTDGFRMINGHDLDNSFPRQIGYVQQEDVHLATSTVRELLQFLAYLRQELLVSKKEKDDWVEYCLNLLEMTEYADAMVGVTGEGLNVEQRKRLLIGVELAAKPKVLLFLDEPTSGLDSQTAWSICKLMRKLCDAGQAILCTIHQPLATLMALFDRLLFMERGGKTVYFGDLGENCQTLIDYFESHGSQKCPPDANPVDWMLEVVGAAPGSHANQEYHDVWLNSQEYKNVKAELQEMRQTLVQRPIENKVSGKYALGLPLQCYLSLKRTLLQDWRDPVYIYSKLFLVVLGLLFNGFSFFKYLNNILGLTNQSFSIFLLLSPGVTLIQQMLPVYIAQRKVYEVREYPSRTYSWFAFFTSQVLSELPIQFILGTIAFFCYYYPVGLYANAVPTHTVAERGALFWMLTSAFYVFITTLGHLCVSIFEDDANGANLASLLFTMLMAFCGVLSGPNEMPHFWIFMYRVSPFTYLILSMLSAGLYGQEVVCLPHEFVKMEPFGGSTCQEFLGPYMQQAGGYLRDPSATLGCQFCPMASTNTFLKMMNATYLTRWRDYGIFLAYPVFNIFMGTFLYWLVRVPHKSSFSNKLKRKSE